MGNRIVRTIVDLLGNGWGWYVEDAESYRDAPDEDCTLKLRDGGSAIVTFGPVDEHGARNIHVRLTAPSEGYSADLRFDPRKKKPLHFHLNRPPL